MNCNGCETRLACNSLGYCQNMKIMSLTPQQEQMLAKLDAHERNRDNLLIGIAVGIEFLLRQSHNDGRAQRTADTLTEMRKKFTNTH